VTVTFGSLATTTGMPDGEGETALSSLDDRLIPPAALIGAGALILTTIVGVGVIQVNKHFAPAVESYNAAPVKTRVLRFIDEGDGVSVYGGHVKVFDVATGAELHELRENDGFVRAVLNSLMFERSKRGVSAAPIFELVQWSDNRVTLKDTATGSLVSLGSFGAGNKAVFLRFFERSEAKS
jgi:putative photosynthetic complex assembly protein